MILSWRQLALFELLVGLGMIGVALTPPHRRYDGFLLVISVYFVVQAVRHVRRC